VVRQLAICTALLACNTRGEIRNVYTILVRKPERRARYRREDNIRMDLTEIRWEDVDWINLAQDRDQWWAVVNTVMNLWVP
jgi:hypothetical protein